MERVIRPFERFGLEHGFAMVLVVAAALVLLLAARRGRRGIGPSEAWIRIPLAAVLVAGLAFAFVDALAIPGLDWVDFLPLHLCDLAVLVAVWALLTREALACELLYFWGLSGTLIAMLTPDLDRGFPDSHCVSFFALHGTVVGAAVVMVFGVGVRPRRGAGLRVFWITNGYAALVGLVDAVAGKNYLYLRTKPLHPSLLDAIGPWPWYILVADALAFTMFWLLMVPFARPHRSRTTRRTSVARSPR